MGLMDAFKNEDRVEVKFSTFYELMKEAVKAELLMNAVNCDTPYASIREMMTGKRETMCLKYGLSMKQEEQNGRNNG